MRPAKEADTGSLAQPARVSIAAAKQAARTLPANALVVMQPDARASYRRIVERVAGTFASEVGAWLIAMLFHSAAVICGAILAVAALVPHHLQHRYWLHTALIALMVLLAYDLTLLGSHGIANLLTERLEDLLLGCAIALVGTAAAFPREAVADFDAIVEDK